MSYAIFAGPGSPTCNCLGFALGRDYFIHPVVWQCFLVPCALSDATVIGFAHIPLISRALGVLPATPATGLGSGGVDGWSHAGEAMTHFARILTPRSELAVTSLADLLVEGKSGEAGVYRHTVADADQFTLDPRDPAVRNGRYSVCTKGGDDGTPVPLRATIHHPRRGVWYTIPDEYETEHLLRAYPTEYLALGDGRIVARRALPPAVPQT